MNFKEQAEQWSAQIQSRKRKPVASGTAAAYQSLLKIHAIPALGHLDLAAVDNVPVKALVEKMADAGLRPRTIINTVGLIKQVVGSARDERGKRLYSVLWDSDYMDIPSDEKRSQKTPTVAGEAVSGAISRANGQEKALIGLLAGTGLRIGEARVLTVGPDGWNPETGVIAVKSTINVVGEIEDHTKTPAGMREVDLDPALNDFLKASVPAREGLMFRTAEGEILPYRTIHYRLKNVGLPAPHSLRRFRATHLAKKNVPEGLIKFWLGHEAGDITERYIKMGSEIETRKTTAAAVGIGFQLEAAC